MTYNSRIFAILFLSAVLMSCGGGRSTDSDNGDGSYYPLGKISDHVFELEYGQTAVLPSGRLSITFAAVIGDSRCPSDVVCVWEGEATIGFQVIAAPADTHIVTLTLRPGCAYRCDPDNAVLDTLGYRFQLLAVDPYPVSTVHTPVEDYRVTLGVFPYQPLDSLADEVVISDLPLSAIQDARFVLDSVRIEGDVITLTIEYSGGCNEHEFELHMSPAAFMESLPVQANLYFRHVDFDDPCDAWFRRSFSFDLRPIAHLYEISYGGIDCIALNVHHYMTGSDPVETVRVLYHPEGAPPTTWCSPREF
jgi:hypothetical protein